MKAHRNEGGGRILLGDNRAGAAMVRPIRFRCASLDFSRTALCVHMYLTYVCSIRTCATCELRLTFWIVTVATVRECLYFLSWDVSWRCWGKAQHMSGVFKSRNFQLGNALFSLHCNLRWATEREKLPVYDNWLTGTVPGFVGPEAYIIFCNNN